MNHQTESDSIQFSEIILYQKVINESDAIHSKINDSDPIHDKKCKRENEVKINNIFMKLALPP